MFKEITAQLPQRGKYGHIITFSVDFDVESGKAKVIGVYTDSDEYENLPAPLKRLNWGTRQNRFFIHVDEADKAWSYLKEHAHYDLE